MNNKPVRTLKDVFNSPDANVLLSTAPKKKAVSVNPDIELFKEIQEWIKQHGGKEPEKTRDISRMKERHMASKLKGYRNNKEMIELFKPYDELGLLDQEGQQLGLEEAVKREKHDFNSLEEILSTNSVLFDNTQQTINSKLFDTKKLNETKKEQENKPKNKSKRKHMDNFAKYEPLFKRVQAELASGARNLVDFKSNQIELHKFYVLNGQLLYIEAIGSEFENNTRSSADVDARVHVIYENGTENTPLRNGLIASLYGSKKRHSYGKIVTEPERANLELSSDDQVTGYIYVLKSESNNPEVKKVQEEHPLYKVGYTNGSVQRRIANAENEATYLYGPVKICEEFQVVNINSEALETAIHHALSNYQLDVDIKATNGKIIHPREWFIADLETINGVVNRIITKLKMS
ncbi:GIY-YIG nuclease family protein [Limosilactobacillus reuteri]|uniref:GIY-YIG nuclease family protein n=1 Tax=Limosilactobacillus reuteri TaxID=1598 RepID=UPI001E381FD5|nr:GIY-YIG nuclease family protein [Limosilactobacillus reuteri]MCC4347856.1 GIY-YIG nuclease family protein [Limosilactobacillus reuteri]MCC4374990.1 GIY-YIG nuclease family protein [Limosilactobacillus reuteri]MCC4385771.1 GIY-YIG nuclease family protein [Limosilactobacillus reuteri]